MKVFVAKFANTKMDNEVQRREFFLTSRMSDEDCIKTVEGVLKTKIGAIHKFGGKLLDIIFVGEQYIHYCECGC